MSCGQRFLGDTEWQFHHGLVGVVVLLFASLFGLVHFLSGSVSEGQGVGRHFFLVYWLYVSMCIVVFVSPLIRAIWLVL